MGRFIVHFSSFRYDFAQVKVKGSYASQNELYILKKLSFSLKNANVKLTLL